MDFESPQIRNCVKSLKEIDFEPAYLALLTHRGIKPLSRWEKPLDEHGLELLRRMGLLTKQIRRTVRTGKEVIETVFSRLPSYIELYERRFAGTPIDKSIGTQLFEGYLFGYPPCCVIRYVRRPYAANNLPQEDQKILFHWACKGCVITPVLLVAYKEVFALLEGL